ncbi:alpha/beta hydrolase [Saccharopolyspora hirsuta]|uniref:Alpha/beta hydrolase n=1 Tax=Saccharopolyspora hirsuta TaxID=1837 RepID=A0A5M7C1R8_SACHI|nr:alpha/beta hydrolase [Saccharopolyspora hirsuta]KAA5835999.1 alpha/beta hydrolase [Saccharopolyspora hirsuta]
MRHFQLTGIGAVAALVLVTACAPTAFAASDLRAQEPAWQPCDFDASVECASIRVPLDYAHPEGEQISIAISRQRASDPAHRRGVLLANPGGPGGSGLTDTNAAGEVVSWPKQRFADTPLSEHYDLIGFDPRGVGRSTPVSCEDTEVSKPIVSRPTEADFDTYARWAKAAEEGCQRASGDVRPFINTRNTARDMDVIRDVLGEEKINYVGYSYGTYLGAVYGAMFPAHLDRSVLDSSLPPNLSWRQVDMASSLANRQNVEAWAEWVGQRDSRFGLGSSKAEVLAAVEATSRALSRTPDEHGFSPQTRFDQAVGHQSTLRSDWPGLAELVRRVGDTGEFTPPEPGTSTVSGYEAVNRTIHCETDWPSDLDVYRRDVELFSEQYPYGWGAATAMPGPCTFRSFTPPEAPTRVERDGYPVGVVVQAEADVQTPYAGGAAMAERLGDRLITVVDDGNHGQYARRGNACVDDAVTGYLVDGVLPPPDLTCAGQPRPDIAPDGQ